MRIAGSNAIENEPGLAVISRGLYESGVVDAPDRPLLLTLLRGFRRAVFASLDDNPGGQTQGTHVFRYEVIPFAGNVPVERLFIAGQRLHGPVRQADLPPQESDAAVPGYVTCAKLPRSASFLSVAGKVVVTSVQRTESGQTLVRLFNSQASKQAIKLSVPAGPALTAAQAVRLDGKPDATVTSCRVRSGTAEIEIAGRRLTTLVLTST